MKIDEQTKNLVKQALEEDIGTGDITTQAIIPPQLKAQAYIVVKENGVIAGLDIAKSVFTELDKKVQFKPLVKDGQKVTPGKKIALLNGSYRAILTGERTALNFLGHLSGIATLTRKFVDEVKPYKVSILDTRKTTPGLRLLEKYAVRCGGGVNHRMGLWDGILVKENHISVCGLADLRIKNIPDWVPIEIEVRNLNELKNALKVKPDIILLDNMNISQIKQAVKLKNKFLLEVSGGVTLANVRQIAKTGVDRISIGALTHSAKALDLSLLIV